MAYILNKGFRIGYDYNNKARRATSNLLSASQNPEVVTRLHPRESKLGQSDWALRARAGCQSSHKSVWGHFPSGHTGKWASNCGLVKPTRNQVSIDGIDPTVCSLTCISVDTVAEKVAQLGNILSKSGC